MINYPFALLNEVVDCLFCLTPAEIYLVIEHVIAMYS